MITKKQCYSIALGLVLDEIAALKELDESDEENIKKHEEVADYLDNEWQALN